MAEKENKKLGGLASAGIFILCWLGTLTAWSAYTVAAGIRGKNPILMLMFVVFALHATIVSLINKSRENSSSTNTESNSKNDTK